MRRLQTCFETHCCHGSVCLPLVSHQENNFRFSTSIYESFPVLTECRVLHTHLSQQKRNTYSTMASLKHRTHTTGLDEPMVTATASVYKCSKQSLRLSSETGRVLCPEDSTWAEKQVPSLRQISLQSIANSLKSVRRPRSAHTSMMSGLLPDDVIRFLQAAPTDTPLAIAAALLPDGLYWQRRANATWTTRNWPRLHGGSWRRLVAERLVQDCLETLTPKSCGAATQTIRPIGEFVVTLRLRNLMESCEQESDDLLQMEIDLRAVFQLLPNLQELHLMFENTDFLKPLNWKANAVKISCCRAIGIALSKMKDFRALKVRRSHVDKAQLAAFLGALDQSMSLTLIDLTSCCVEDVGARMLAEALSLSRLPALQELLLADNGIGPSGAIAIGSALRNAFSKGDSCLSVLSFSLNTLRDAGAYAILSSLYQTKYPPIETETDLEKALETAASVSPPSHMEITRGTTPAQQGELTYYGFPKTQRGSNDKGSPKGFAPTQLFLAAVEMTHTLSTLIRDVINSTKSLVVLDVRNNHLGEEACAMASQCDRLIRLDTRMSGGTPKTEAVLWQNTLRKANEIQPYLNLRAIRENFERKLREEHSKRKPCVQPPQQQISIGGAIAVIVAVPHWRKHTLRGYIPAESEVLKPDATKVPF